MTHLCEHCGERDAMRELSVGFECRHHGEHRRKVLRQVGVLPGGAPTWVYALLAVVCVAGIVVVKVVGAM